MTFIYQICAKFSHISEFCTYGNQSINQIEKAPKPVKYIYVHVLIELLEVTQHMQMRERQFAQALGYKSDRLLTIDLLLGRNNYIIMCTLVEVSVTGHCN